MVHRRYRAREEGYSQDHPTADRGGIHIRRNRADDLYDTPYITILVSTAEPVYGFPPRLMTSQKVRTPWEGGFSYHHPAQLVRLR